MIRPTSSLLVPAPSRPASALIALGALCLAWSPPASSATYYVRPDGGSIDRCTGLVDVPAPAAGGAQPCAFDHPFRVLPPGGPPRMSGGDTLVVGSGSYMMGLGASGADGCSSDYPWECFMTAVPSGPDAAHPTRLLGSGWDSGCASPPELWGTERAQEVINLTRSSNVEIACFVVTDHSGCVESHSGSLACNRDVFPYGAWAARGLYAEDSSSVRLANLNIHGLAGTGIQAGRLRDWTVEDVRIAGNGWSGWDGDLGGDSSNAGSMTFRRLTIEWNGCGETYPGREPTGCWAQSAGGYGDGLGTGATSGNWLFEDSAFLHNTSDGLDLLYARLGSTITIRRTLAEGNAGNQIKTNGPTTIENSILVGNCAFFEGKSFTLNVDACRAAGNTLSLDLRAGDLVTLTNSTLAGQGDCLLIADCDLDRSACVGTESVRMRNNIFVGDAEFLASGDRSCLVYQETFPHGNAVFDFDYALVTGVQNDDCPGSHHLCGVSPGLVSSSLTSFDAHLLASSPAVNAGTPVGAPAVDFDGLPRDAAPDLGAYEVRSSAPCALECSATVPSTAGPGTPVAFSGTASSSDCSGTPAYDWDFGDGSAHATTREPVHTYTASGTYPWTLTVRQGSGACIRTGSISVGSGSGGCSADATTLCLLGGRFSVRAAYRDYGGATGAGRAVVLTPDTGAFWFFNASNLEVMAKMVSFCGSGSNDVAVYAAGLTDLFVTLTVTDTRTGQARSYTNPLGIPFQMVRDGPFSCP